MHIAAKCGQTAKEPKNHAHNIKNKNTKAIYIATHDDQAAKPIKNPE